MTPTPTPIVAPTKPAFPIKTILAIVSAIVGFMASRYVPPPTTTAAHVNPVVAAVGDSPIPPAPSLGGPLPSVTVELLDDDGVNITYEGVGSHTVVNRKTPKPPAPKPPKPKPKPPKPQPPHVDPVPPPLPPPVLPSSPAGLAAVKYRDSIPSALRSIASDYRAGKVSKDQIGNALYALRKPSAEELANAINASGDPAGAMEDAAKVFELSTANGGK